MARAIPKTVRRGVLLLIVLGMLAMFGLIAVTFVLITGHHERAAEITERIGQDQSRPEVVLDQALGQLLVGSTRENSVLQTHSLLEDLYGNRSVFGRVDDSNGDGQFMWARGRGQIVEIEIVFLDAAGNIVDVDPANCVGRVITFTSGNAAGDSTRIVGFRRFTGPLQYRLQILAPGWVPPVGPDGQPGIANQDDDANGVLDDDSEMWRTATSDDVAVLARGNQFVINGREFGGTGFGFFNGNADSGGLLGAAYFRYPPVTGTQYQFALLPNPAPFRDTDLALADRDTDGANGVDYTYDDPAGPGGANEDYDAVDHQNMLLAMVLPQAADLNNDGVADTNVPIPSLHRPALINYWFNRLLNDPALGSVSDVDDKWRVLLRPWGLDGIRNNADDGSSPWSLVNLADRDRFVDLKRRFILRPIYEDHPNFDGSNPVSSVVSPTPSTAGFWERFGPWDVDNDGDGYRDSIWVDLGLTARATPSGKLYKPLFAFLCADLDGRLNLNAAGSLAQTDASYTGSATVSGWVFAGGASTASLPRGLGFGPAEINLSPLLNNDLTVYQRLLQGIPGNDILLGRYGSNRVPGAAGFDPLSVNQHYQYGGDYWSLSVNGPGSYGSPPDRDGDGAIGLDPAGRPLYPLMADTDGDNKDHPYETNLFNPQKDDLTFTIAELERLLRWYDLDVARLPDRLRQLAPNLASRRNEITTHSFDVPTPSVAIPEELETTLKAANNWQWLYRFRDQESPAVDDGATYPPKSFRDVLAFRLFIEMRANGVLGDNPVNAAPPPNGALTNRQLFINTVNRALGTQVHHYGALVPPAMLSGLRMDLNAPFGNGRDSTLSPAVPGYGVVDEIEESCPLINRLDDDADSSWDETDEASLVNSFYQVNAATAPIAGIPFTVTNDAFVDLDGNGRATFIDANGDGLAAEPGPEIQLARKLLRQTYARHLYVLMMLALDRGYADGGWGTPEDRARMVAQWAVNVVDFRDRDSIMTPFEYDIYPFQDNNGDGNTWDVNGLIGPEDDDYATGYTNNLPADDGQPYRGLVWGTERPELLITETLALHDRRVENLADYQSWYEVPTTDPLPDPSVWDNDFDQRKKPQGSLFIELYNPNSSLEPRPAELCDSTTGGVQLNKTITASPNLDGVTYTWPVWRLAIVPGTDFDDDPDADPGDPLPTIERSVYFVDPASGAGAPGDYALAGDGDRFHTTAAMAAIAPGRYSIIGSAENDTTQPEWSTTYIGRRTGTDAIADPDDVPNNLDLADNPNDTAVTRQIRLREDPTGAPGDSEIRTTAVYANGAGEPSAGQINPVVAIPINEPRRLSITEPYAGYPDYTSGTSPSYDPPLDEPLDNSRPDLSTEMQTAVRTSGTTARAAVVHLQRLANPLQPYHSTANPYRTVDSATIDLVAFNGWSDDDVIGAGYHGDGATDGTMMVECNERGEGNLPVDGPRNLWIQRLALKGLSDTPPDGDPETPTHYLEHILNHTLGYLNEPFGAYRTSAPNLGDPATTPAFPWLTWLNRPFVTPLELTLVPAAKSSRLLNTAFTASPAHPYVFGLAPATPNPFDVEAEPFTHLANFFNSNGSPTAAPERHRLFNFVGVPSPFAAADMQLDPLRFAELQRNMVSMQAWMTHSFYPPFNRIARYREPGKININTIFSDTVFEALMNDSPPGMTAPQKAAFWQAFVWSRRGYPSAFNQIYEIDANYPTEFVKPFRSQGGRNLIPLAAMQTAIGDPVESTLLRSDPVNPGRPLFQFDDTIAPGGVAAYNNPDRNPTFRYQSLDRLGNLVTTRSNVYACWVTVGFFEVQQGPQTLVSHPDGMYLGPELGFDTGEITRHRAFYVIDRSIPVGFVRGQALNAGNTILVKRIIE